MKIIVINSAKYGVREVFVDDKYYDYLSQFKWGIDKVGVNIYAKRSIWYNGKNHNIRMHREVIGARVGEIVDHRDMNGLNNQESNIRLCTRAENNRNKSGEFGCSSRYKGVRFHPKHNRFHARIGINGRSIHLGTFKNEDDAALAYNLGALKYHGEFAYINTIG